MYAIYVLCGIPASGKSTLAKSIIADKHYCFDELVKDYHGRNVADFHRETANRMFTDIQINLQNGLSVVCDHLLITKEKRLELFSYVPDGCKKICIVLDTPLEECLRRNASRETRLPDFVIIQSAQMYEPPILEEGWDEIRAVQLLI